MDSLTQIVLGAAVGEAVLGKKVGNKAMLYGAIAGTIPDLDIFASYFTDTVTAIEMHRGFSHSIVFSILMAPILGWIVHKMHKREEATFRDWSWLFFWGLFTHPILDAFTTWGTQLFWPSEVRLAFRNIFVIDPLYTLPFLVFLVLAMRQKKTAPKRSKYNTWGLYASTSYLIITLILKGVTYKKFKDNLHLQGISYSNISTRTAPFNTLLWSANVDTKDAYLIGTYSLFDSKPISFVKYPKNHEVLDGLIKYDKVKRLIKITEGWYTVTQKNNELYLNDLRFGLMSLDPNEKQFAFSYKLIEKSQDVVVEETPKVSGDVKKLFKALWQRMWGN